MEGRMPGGGGGSGLCFKANSSLDAIMKTKHLHYQSQEYHLLELIKRFTVKVSICLGYRTIF